MKLIVKSVKVQRTLVFELVLPDRVEGSTKCFVCHDREATASSIKLGIPVCEDMGCRCNFAVTLDDLDELGSL